MLTAILAALASVGSAAGSAAGAAGSAIGSAAGAAGSALASGASAAGSAIGQAAGTVGSAIGEAGSAIGSGIGEAASTVGEYAGKAAQSLGVGSSGTGPSTGSYLSSLRGELATAGHSPALASNPAQAATALQNPGALATAFGETGIGGVMQNPSDWRSWAKMGQGGMRGSGGGGGQQQMQPAPGPAWGPYQAPRLTGLRPAIPRGALLGMRRQAGLGPMRGGLYG